MSQPLKLGFDHTGLEPPVIHALDDITASIQTWAGQQSADGRWIVPGDTPANLLRVDGAGNSWTMGNVYGAFGYSLIGNTMLLNFRLPNTALTIGAATNLVYVRLPDSYRVAGALDASTGAVSEGRVYYSMCFLINSAAAFSGLMTANPGGVFIYIQKVGGANFVTSTDFTVFGQIALEVVKL